LIPTPLIVMPEVHVQGLPAAGMMIVSPFTATCVGPLMTAFTSGWLQVAAVKVPCALVPGHAIAVAADKQSNPKHLTLEPPVNLKKHIFIITIQTVICQLIESCSLALISDLKVMFRYPCARIKNSFRFNLNPTGLESRLRTGYAPVPLQANAAEC
jgi:hypothetical protein